MARTACLTLFGQSPRRMCVVAPDEATSELQDAMTVDVSKATVVTLCLLSTSNRKLRPLLIRQLKPGARIVSHAFGVGDWEPARVDQFQDSRGISRTLYLWQADGKVRE